MPRPTRRRRFLLLAVVAGLVIALGGTGLLFFSDGGLLGGRKALSSPSDCRTPLEQTHTCQGWDESWQECRFAFRAEGVPVRELCERFLRVPAPAASALPGGRTEPCSYTDERSWTRVDCSLLGLDAGLSCFYCQFPAHEADNEYVQAFAPGCDRGIILRACNVGIAQAAQVEPGKGP